MAKPFRLLAGLVDKLRMRWLRRDEYESVALRAYFAERWEVIVGAYSYGCFDPWRIPRRTRIGRYCSFAKSARVLDSNHPFDAISTHPFLYEAKFGMVAADRLDPPWLIIEDDVWISHNVTITPGCKFIGRGSIIGAGAVVTRDVPAYTIVGGIPATTLRRRFDDATIANIEASRWWELDRSALAELVARDPEAVFAPAAVAMRKSLG